MTSSFKCYVDHSHTMYSSGNIDLEIESIFFESRCMSSVIYDWTWMVSWWSNAQNKISKFWYRNFSNSPSFKNVIHVMSWHRTHLSEHRGRKNCDVHLPSLLTSALFGGKCSASRPTRLNLRDGFHGPLRIGLVETWYQSWSFWNRKNSCCWR